jgi:C4-dicarboxylate-specific signal transduction histidine kinase
MKNFLRIKKIALWFGVAFFIVSFGTIVFMSFAQRQLIVDVNKKSLQISASEKSAQVNIFLEFQKENLKIISSMNVFKEAVLHPDDPAKIEIAKDRIDELKSVLPGISLLTNEGIVLNGEIDLSEIVVNGQSYFALKEKKIIVKYYYCECRKKDFYVIAGPIYDSIEKDKVIGIIAFDIELEKISALMKENLDSGENEEVYLIDENGLLLSSSKYIRKGNKGGILIQEVKSDGAKNCLEHIKKYSKGESVEEHAEDILQYTNYMGDEVFGAHAYVSEIMGCVVAEESADEILKFSMLYYIKNIFNK